ncbi:MAG: sugar ABC transporter permease [Ruminococcaceae bacterium]|nr:sugar ABC transporter permease [Oscillospiraceae bacterium]
MNSEAKIKSAKPQAKKRRRAALDSKKSRAGWAFIMPFALIFLAVYLPILFTSAQYSFHELVKVTGGYDLDFVGFDNFNYALFSDAKFTETLVTGVQTLIFQIPAIVIFSLFMAVLLNQEMPGRTLFRAIFFVPVIISTGIMETVNAADVFGGYAQGGAEAVTDPTGDNGSGSTGSQAAEIISTMDIQALFMNMKIGQGLVQYVVDIVNNIYDIVNKAGVQMLIFLAGLQGISPAIYESCTVDGATAWETFWKITFPMISPMILVNAIYTVIDAFTSDGNSVMRYISTVSTNSAIPNSTTVAQAMYWMYFLFVVLIIVVIAAICSAFVFYQRRD